MCAAATIGYAGQRIVMMSDQSVSPPAIVEAWVRKTIGSAAPLRFEALVGATSSSVYSVMVGDLPTFVLRLFTNRDWLSREPDLAEHEAAALTHAARVRMPTPQLIGHAGAAECGDPAILMTHLPGSVDLRPRRRRSWLAALADALAAIHTTDVGDFHWRYTSWNPQTDAAMPAWLANPTLWSAVSDLAARRPAQSRHTFLHRDYHPTNVLWSNKRISGVVDWVNACAGPAGVDVAHCRLNLALMYGIRYADDFLRAYTTAVGGYDHDPHWDVDDAMDWTLHGAAHYPPWRDFGLRPISRDMLRDRMREFLQNAVDRR